MKRRTFLQTTAAMAFAPGTLLAASNPARTLTIAPTQVQLAPAGYPKTAVWTYDGAIPGVPLRFTQGDRLSIRAQNDLPQPTSIHWHGLRLPNAMDGVSGLTQQAIAPGQQFDYEFDLPDAGTYWYHAHNMSPEQVGRGLHGPLIIAETQVPDVDSEDILVLDDWLLDAQAVIDPDFTAMHDLSHGGRVGNFVTTNGQYDLRIPVKRHARLRLRLINAANARIFPLALQGLEGWIVALDGMPLATPEKIAAEFVIAPAQRVDLIVDVTADDGSDAFLVRLSQDGSAAQVTFPVRGQMTATARAAPVALPPNPQPEGFDLANARPVDLPIAGGAMGQLQQAQHDGKTISFQQMIDAGLFWSMAGSAGRPADPLVDVSLGETVRLTIRNDTMFPHAMHLHGMHFHELDAGGTLGALRDTTLIGGRETRDIAFVAANPGDWLLHCHMLGHAASGMMHWLRVS